MLTRTRNSAVASSRIDISVIGVSTPLRRNSRNVKISISDSRGAQPVTVKCRADALNEHATSIIPDGTFWNFNKDWLPPSLRRFSVRDVFWGIDRRLLRWNFKTDYCEASVYFVWANAWWNCSTDKDILTIFGKIFHKKVHYTYLR